MTEFFCYDLVGTGWAELRISNSQKVIDFQISYLSDPLSDLLEALVNLNANKSVTEKIIFAEEPGQHSLVLTLSDVHNLKIEIYAGDEWEPISKAYGNTINEELIYSDTDTLSHFTDLIINCLQQLQNKYSTSHYNDKWYMHEFPVEKLEKLMTLVR